MSIIEERETPPIASVSFGQPFRRQCSAAVAMVRVTGLPGHDDGKIPAVVLVDSGEHEKHEIRGTHFMPGWLVRLDPTERVELLKLVKTPVYKVI